VKAELSETEPLAGGSKLPIPEVSIVKRSFVYVDQGFDSPLGLQRTVVLVRIFHPLGEFLSPKDRGNGWGCLITR